MLSLLLCLSPFYDSLLFYFYFFFCCFSACPASLLVCFSASPFFCLSVFLIRCFTAFCFPRLSVCPASLLLLCCFFAFHASLPIRFCANVSFCFCYPCLSLSLYISMSLSPFLSLLVFLFRMFLITCRSSFPPVINASCSCGCYGSSVWRGSLRKHPVSFLSHGASRDKKSTCPGCSCATRGTAAPCSTKSRRGRKTSSSDLCSAHHVIGHEESQHNRDSESSLHGSQNPALKLHRRTSHSCAMALDRPPKLTSPVQSAVFTIPNISKSPDGKQESNYHGTFSA